VKATTIIAGTVVTASVAYIGYRIYRASKDQAKPINEANALNPADAPVDVVTVTTKQLAKPAIKAAPSFFGDVIRFKQPVEEPASFPAMVPLTMPFPTRSNFGVAAMMDIVTPSRAVSTPYGSIMVRSGETVEQATTRYLNANPDVRAAHGL
jgi:hypothetical protein